MKRILVTGGNGQLGQELKRMAPLHPHFDWIFLNRSSLDITVPAQISTVFHDFSPDVCINCAAYTKVDAAESDPVLSNSINTHGVENLVNECTKFNARLIHFSTDYVYNPEEPIPIDEDFACTPQSNYGLSKLNGDLAVQSSKVPWLIFRVSWLYSSFGSNFVKTMIRLGREKDTIRVVNDQVGSPTYARDLAEVVITSLGAKLDLWNEVYHYSNQGRVSWMDFAKEIFRLMNYDCKVIPLTSEEFGAAAKRPAWSVLSTKKIHDAFGLVAKDWKKSLKDCVEELTSLN